MKPPRYWIGLVLTAFLAPILGGQIAVDPQAIPPGGLLVAVFREPQGAALAHLLVALPALAVLVWALVHRHVLQLPQSRVTVSFAVFLLFVWGSVAMSSYRMVSFASAVEWTAMLLIFFAVVGLAGRQVGPTQIVGGFVAGTTVVALIGISEYTAQSDSNWRIFANWFHPNALAALLAYGVLGGLGFLASAKERIVKLLAGLASVLCVTALVLTGSKGGFLALVAGLTVLIVWWLVLGGGSRGRLLALAIVVPLLGLSMAVGTTAAHRAKNPGSGSGAALGRIAQGGSTQEQSAGFRTLLWQSSLELIKDQPIGRGIGTFRFHSARPGLVTQTHFAHQSFLQLGAEAGLVALIALIAAVLMIAIEGMRGVRRLPDGLRALKGAVFAALGAALVHNLIDSDLYMFGTGVGFFLFAALLLQLSPDGSNPEFTPRPVRWVAALLADLTVLALLYFAVVDVRLGGLRHLAGEGNPEAKTVFNSVTSLAPWDHRLWLLGARIEGDRKERIARLQRSIQHGPTLPAYRALAQDYIGQEDAVGAQRTLNEALRLDRNNLAALRRLMQISEGVDDDQASVLARRLVDVESTSYYKIRALPELVPTETLEARAWLASHAPSAAEQADLLRGALEGYRAYAERTVPMVVMFAKSGMDGGYGSISRDQAHQTLTTALDLVAMYESSAPDQRVWAAETRTILESARTSLTETTP